MKKYSFLCVLLSWLQVFIFIIRTCSMSRLPLLEYDEVDWQILHHQSFCLLDHTFKFSLIWKQKSGFGQNSRNKKWDIVIIEIKMLWLEYRLDLCRNLCLQCIPRLIKVEHKFNTLQHLFCLWFLHFNSRSNDCDKGHVLGLGCLRLSHRLHTN